MDHIGLWWEALKANNVPRKLWLLRAGHEDPFESQRGSGSPPCIAGSTTGSTA